MKKILFISCIFFTLYSNAQLIDTIHWKANYKLKWNDFKGNPDSNSFAAAITSTIITYSVLKKDSSLTIKIYCYFLRDASWTWTKGNSILLKHEQGHFDIAELFTRKFRVAIKGKKFYPYTVNNELDAILTNILNNNREFDKVYDNETDFSKDAEKQIFWSKKIMTELNKLNLYKN
jgi:hypothetical protein